MVSNNSAMWLHACPQLLLTSSFPADNYIIPLAKKLKECNVFGVSSDECLNYAMRNRQEWEDRGTEVTNAMIQRLQNVVVPPLSSGPEVFQDEFRETYENELEC